MITKDGINNTQTLDFGQIKSGQSHVSHDAKV